VPGEQERGTDRPRRVDVVPTGVHHPGHRGGERQPRGLVDGERVDVAADRHQGGVPVTAGEPRDDAGSGDARDLLRA
jgi:hypothetical protein